MTADPLAIIRQALAANVRPRSAWERAQLAASLTDDSLEERAAIIAEGCGVAQAEAERLARAALSDPAHFQGPSPEH